MQWRPQRLRMTAPGVQYYKRLVVSHISATHSRKTSVTPADSKRRKPRRNLKIGHLGDWRSHPGSADVLSAVVAEGHLSGFSGRSGAGETPALPGWP
jgi:hypothetical protein